MNENPIKPQPYLTLVPCCSSENEVLGKSEIDEIFKNMDILVDKEIKRNKSTKINHKIVKTERMKIQNQEGLLINDDEETNKSCPYCGIFDENEKLRPEIVKNELRRVDHVNCFSTFLHMSTKKSGVRARPSPGC